MKILVSSPHRHLGHGLECLEVGAHLLRCDWSPGEIEGMIGWWEMTEEFLGFKGHKVFYCCEPSFYFDGFRASKRLLRRRLRGLRQDEFAWHYHPDRVMRVVHYTLGPDATAAVADCPRQKKAVAVVSNLGHPLGRNGGRQQRIQFIVKSDCDIYGHPNQWNRFQLHPWSTKGPPRTYRGPSPSKCETLSAYHACICLENTSEPLYFTEKFPDAVRAGCVPIYSPHPSVRREFLEGAVWVDPADHDWDARATLQAALSLDRRAVREANDQWLAKNPAFLRTRLVEVYRHLADILQRKAAGEIHLPGPATRERLKDEC